MTGFSAVQEFLEQTRLDCPRPESVDPRWMLPPAKQIAAPELARMLENLEPKLSEFDSLVEHIERCERNLAAVPHEDAVKGEVQAVERARQDRERLAMRKELLEEEQRKIISDLDRKKAQLQAKLDSLAEQTLAEKTTQRMLKHSARARETLGKYREEIAKSHMLRLEHLITESFNQLHRKKRIGHSVSIDRDSYDIKLVERNGKHVSSEELSAGERQLLAISILWALAQASGRKLPTIIDTPLGRLDSKHRNLLVQNYFPRASHQVILFSTDEEITSRYYRALSASIGLEYSIIFDETKRSSVVLPRYFSREELAA
jgi:DNA sulfur modification protein DndD